MKVASPVPTRVWRSGDSPVGVRDRGQQGDHTPENGAQNNDQLARVPVGQRSDKGRGDHVENQKRAGEISELSVAEMKFVPHQRLHRKQDGAVDVVEKVERGREDQRRPGINFALGHLGKEYNMHANPQGVILSSEADRFGTNRSTQSKDPCLSTNCLARVSSIPETIPGEEKAIMHPAFIR